MELALHDHRRFHRFAIVSWRDSQDSKTELTIQSDDGPVAPAVIAHHAREAVPASVLQLPGLEQSAESAALKPRKNPRAGDIQRALTPRVDSIAAQIVAKIDVWFKRAAAHAPAVDNHPISFRAPTIGVEPIGLPENAVIE